jgi:hypothetical protein
VKKKLRKRFKKKLKVEEKFKNIKIIEINTKKSQKS